MPSAHERSAATSPEVLTAGFGRADGARRLAAPRVEADVFERVGEGGVGERGVPAQEREPARLRISRRQQRGQFRPVHSLSSEVQVGYLDQQVVQP